MILEWFNTHLHILTVVWLFPIIFMFHDFEEILTVESWVKQNKDFVFKKIPPFMHKHFYSSFQITTVQFAQDVFRIFLAITASTLIAVLFSFYFPYLMFLALFFAHVFTHIGQAVYLRKYTPGVMTSIFLVLPYSLYAYYRLLAEAVITSGDIIWSSLSMCAGVPFIFLYLVRSRNWRA